MRQHCYVYVTQCSGSACDLRAVQVKGQDFLLCLHPGDQLPQKAPCRIVI